MEQNVPIKKNFQDVKEHYVGLRKLVYQYTERKFSNNFVSLREISYNDAINADKWTNLWPEKRKRPIWSWVKMYDLYQGRNELKRFDLAV